MKFSVDVATTPMDVEAARKCERSPPIFFAAWILKLKLR